jgi:hypothetical protein
MVKIVSEEEWNKIIEKSDSIRMKFHELFSIKCLKCCSDDVEIFGDYDSSGCYYEGDTGDMIFVVKCHKCGNAKVFKSFGYMNREKIDD